jgi:hypothetical protein
MKAGPASRLQGRRVHVYWPKMRCWYVGAVGEPHARDVDVFQVIYDDGAKQWEQFGHTPGACIWGLAVEKAPPGSVHDISQQQVLTPPRHPMNDEWHAKEPNQLMGVTVHVQSQDATSWRLAVVVSTSPNSKHVLLEFVTGEHAWHDFGPGRCFWILAAGDPMLHAVLNKRGIKRLHEFQHGNANDVLVNVSLKRAKRAFGILTRSQCLCLGGGDWLNDAVIEVCMAILCNTADCTVVKQAFYRQLVQQSPISANHTKPAYTDSLKTWFKGAAGTAMWLKRKVLVVVHVRCDNAIEEPWETAVGNHWVLAVVDIEHQTFRYYDPLGEYGRDDIYYQQQTQCLKNLAYWLRIEHDMPWLAQPEVVHQVHTPRPIQGNSWDCGVYTILAGLCESLSISLDSLPWGQQHATVIRQQLAALLMQ